MTLTGSRWKSNNDITRCDRKFSSLESVYHSSRQWEPDTAESWALRAPGWAAQQNEKEMLLKTKELRGQYVAVFVQSPTHLLHITLSQPFRIKWEVYFSKEVCSFVIIELTMFPHVCVYMYYAYSWLWLCNTSPLGQGMLPIGCVLWYTVQALVAVGRGCLIWVPAKPGNHLTWLGCSFRNL